MQNSHQYIFEVKMISSLFLTNRQVHNERNNWILSWKKILVLAKYKI
jgi:hypothetical protein